MINELHLLKLNSEGASTKQKIIHVLGEEWPLTAKQIYTCIRKNSAITITYQAIHKTLKELLEDGIVSKMESKYSLSKNWVENVKQFGTSLHKRYFEGDSINIKKLLQEGSFNLRFKNPMQMGRFLVEFMKELKENPSTPIAFKWFHAWPLVGFSDEEMKGLRQIFSSGPLYIAHKHEMPIDKISLEVFAGFGAKIIKRNLQFNEDVMVVGDYVLHVHFDPKKKLEWHKMCMKTSKSNRFGLLQQLFRISEDDFPITVLAGKSPELAKGILKEFR